MNQSANSPSQSAQPLQLTDLTTGYGRGSRRIEVSQHLTATIEEGSFTCLIGVNGSGKSTLLRTLAGLQPPLGGHVEIFGKDIATIGPRQLPRLISLVLTSRVETPNMTVEQLITLGRAPYTGFWGTASASDRQVVERAAEIIGISDLLNRRVVTLSDGENQKVMIAKAIAQDTPLIFLDEPTAFLDYPGKIEIMQLLRRLARNYGKTVFMSTHDLPLALQTAHSLWLLDRHYGITCGDPRSLAAGGEVARYFNRGDVVFNPDALTFDIPL